MWEAWTQVVLQRIRGPKVSGEQRCGHCGGATIAAEQHNLTVHSGEASGYWYREGVVLSK